MAMANPMAAVWGKSIQGPPFDFTMEADDRSPGGISVVHIGIGPILDD
jgi:hypothetical protein